MSPSAESNGVSPQDKEADVFRSIINQALDKLNPSIREVNRKIHDNPELGYKEYMAHDTLCDYLESQGFDVKRKAWGVDTAFDASIGSGGRQVIFCAEYDALPGIGHACGHNLIATSSLAAFVGAAAALKESNVPGRLRLLGTPAEEGGGGKIKLLNNGAFDPPEDVAASIMAHPVGSGNGETSPGENWDGVGGMTLLMSHKMQVEFIGNTAHAAAEPWSGINALDAAVAAYNNVSMLRQQLRLDERVHGVFERGGDAPNVIPDYTRQRWFIRAPTLKQAERLLERVKQCLDAGARATGCEIKYIYPDVGPYLNLRINDALCGAYAKDMAAQGLKVRVREAAPFAASTDMGNISHYVPSFHGGFKIPTSPDVAAHNPKFAACAGTDEAHKCAMQCAKGMAMLAMRVLTDAGGLAEHARSDHETAPR